MKNPFVLSPSKHERALFQQPTQHPLNYNLGSIIRDNLAGELYDTFFDIPPRRRDHELC